jgi:hypothetical protein
MHKSINGEREREVVNKTFLNSKRRHELGTQGGRGGPYLHKPGESVSSISLIRTATRSLLLFSSTFL